MDNNIENNNVSYVDDAIMFEKRYNEVKDYFKNEKPLEWHKSWGYFYAPISFFILSIIFLLINKSTNYTILFLLISINFLFISYNFLLWSNQKILIYSNKLVVQYGLFKTYTKEFEYGTSEIDAITAGKKRNQFQKIFNYSNFFIINDRKMFFTIYKVSKPEALHDLIKNKYKKYINLFDPSYELTPTEFVKRSGTYILDSDGKLIDKEEL